VRSRRVVAATTGLILGLLLVLVSSPVAAQDEDVSEDTEASATDRSAEQVIQVLDVVEGDDGEVIMDVAVPGVIGDLPLPLADNFGIALRGTLLDVEDVTPLTTPVDVIVAIDTSSSMRGAPLRDAKLAAINFIDQLPPEARVGVIGFGEIVDVLSTPSTDRNEALAQIDALEAVGQTPLWEALVQSAQIAATTIGQDGQAYVVLLADGDNSTEGVTQADAIRELVESDVALYAIAVRSAESNGDQLREVAEEVGGIFTTAETTEELESLYENIAARLASRYQLTFQSDNAAGGNLVVSVAQGTAVATTRTTLQGFGTPAASEEPDGPARVLNVPEEATLGAVSAPNPGLLGQPLMLPIGAAAVFLSLLFLGLLVANPAIDVRLDTASGADRIAGVNSRLSSIADRFVARRDQEGELDKALDAAGLHLRPGEFVLISIVVVVLLSAAGWLLGGALLGVLLGGLGAVGVLIYLNRRAQKQRNRFADQLTDTLSILIGSLRAGRGLPQAIELVAEEAPSPTAEQFRRVVFETQVGRDMTESMMGVAQRMKSQDFEWVARAVAINRELGGDLTEVLRNVGNTIRERRRVARMVRALSAEGRASGWVLLALPVLMFLFLWWRTPENVGLLTETGLGRTMLLIAGLGMVVGYFWIRKLVDLKY